MPTRPSSERAVICELSCFAGNVVVDGIAASNHILQEHGGLFLDAAATERFKDQVRGTLSSIQCWT